MNRQDYRKHVHSQVLKVPVDAEIKSEYSDDWMNSVQSICVQQEYTDKKGFDSIFIDQRSVSGILELHYLLTNNEKDVTDEKIFSLADIRELFNYLNSGRVKSLDIIIEKLNNK